MKEQEVIVFSNSIGTITSKVVKVKPSKGRPTAILLAEILEVTGQLKRKYLYAALCLAFGLAALFVALFPAAGSTYTIGSFLVPAVLIIAGIANLLGYIVIVIRTATADIRLEDVEFNKLKDGRAFVEALKKMIPDQKQITVSESQHP